MRQFVNGKIERERIKIKMGPCDKIPDE